MDQTSIIVAALILGFLIYITAIGKLRNYLALFI